MKRLCHTNHHQHHHQVSAAAMGLLADTIIRFDSAPTGSSPHKNNTLLRIISFTFRQIGNMNKTTSKKSMVRHRGLRSASMAASLLSVLCSREDWTEYSGINLENSAEIESLTKDLTICFFDKVEGRRTHFRPFTISSCLHFVPSWKQVKLQRQTFSNSRHVFATHWKLPINVCWKSDRAVMVNSRMCHTVLTRYLIYLRVLALEIVRSSNLHPSLM